MPKKKKKPRSPNKSSSGGGGSIGKFRSGFKSLVKGKKKSTAKSKSDTFWTILTILLAIFIIVILFYRYMG